MNFILDAIGCVLILAWLLIICVGIYIFQLGVINNWDMREHFKLMAKYGKGIDKKR